MNANYKEINRKAWNAKTDIHYKSAFYDVEGFINGASSLNEIELELLGDLTGLSILHLQCHFGQDTISLNRMGAKVTGIDLSDRAIERARSLAEVVDSDANFICCDLYDLPKHLDQKFDLVFSSYGTIGWLPDIHRWATIINQFLKPGGQFVFAEFHPVVWMFDDDFTRIKYNYFNDGPIEETESGTYAETDADITADYVMWNHSLGSVITGLLGTGMKIEAFQEYDYSPYDCFSHTEEISPGKYRIKHMGGKLPMVYALKAIRPAHKSP